VIGIKTLDRYLLREVFAPLGGGLAIFTFALVAARLPKLIELIVNHGLGIAAILKLMGYIVPTFLETTFPMTILLGVLLGFGRLSGDQELTAVRACGVSLYRLAAPIVIFTLLVACPLEAWLAFSVRPWANYKMNQELFNIIQTQAMAGLKEKVFNDRFPGIVMYVDHIEPPATKLDGVLITDARDPAQQSTIVARNGLVIADETRRLMTLRLLEGSIFGGNPQKENFHVSSFDVYDVTLRPAEHIAMMGVGPKEMSYARLRREIAERRKSGKPDFEAETEMARKFTTPPAALLFAILGVSLGIKPARGGQSERFVLSILFFFLYFILLRIGQSIAEAGQVNPYIATSVPDLVFAIIAVRLFYRAANDKTDHARGPGDVVWDIIRRFERTGAKA
jgi:lipopolysaccharide export system permease protein